MGVVGLRDLLFVAPHPAPQVASDPHAAPFSNGFNPATATATALGVGVGVGVFPLLTLPESEQALNKNYRDATTGAGIHHFWRQQQQHQHSDYAQKTVMGDDSGNLPSTSTGGGVAVGGSGSMSSSGGATCQDCGNQAKKDCSHRRCRTCCKSRGFACSTHVKSTWVPAARRRERQLLATAAAATGASSGSNSGGKKPRLVGCTSQMTTASHTSNSNDHPTSLDASSCHQDASFKETLPGQVRTPAVFRCVRVTALEEGEDEYAYQAMVKIGGHVFKGFLYDQGAQPVDAGHDQHPNISDLHLGGGGGGVRNNGASFSSPMMDAVADVLLGGAAAAGYGNQIS